MAIVFGLWLGAGALAAVLTFACALGLGRSDAAGNGLAEAYVAIATAVTTLLVVGALLVALGGGHPTDSGEAAATIGCTALAVAMPWPTLRSLFARRSRRGLRTALAGLTALAQLGILLHAADRTFALALPAGLATLGPVLLGALALAAPLLTDAVGRARRETSRPSPFAIAWPALVVREGEAVFVVREASGLTTLDPAVFTRPPAACLFDANATPWTLVPAATLAGWTTTRAGAPRPLDDVRTRLLVIPRLHPDPAQDAEVRRLVAMQASIAALTFVLPR